MSFSEPENLQHGPRRRHHLDAVTKTWVVAASVLAVIACVVAYAMTLPTQIAAMPPEALPVQIDVMPPEATLDAATTGSANREPNRNRNLYQYFAR